MLHVPLTALLVQAPLNAALVKLNIFSKVTRHVRLALLEGGQKAYILAFNVLPTALIVQAPLNAALVNRNTRS